MTQGYPLLPTIFNVVVDAVVRYWDSLVVERAGGDSSNYDAAHPAVNMVREIDDR